MRCYSYPVTRSVIRFVVGLAAGAALVTAHGAGVPASQEVAWLTRLAEHGDNGAQLQLGLAYREGRYGLRPDASAARHWLDEAAAGGNAYAARVERLPAGTAPVAAPGPGKHPFNDLVDRLDLPGLNALAAVWHTVEVSSPSSYSADALLARAHDGDPLAEYQLGLRYRDGSWAVEPDSRKAQQWLQRAADAGNPLAAQALAETRTN